MGENSPVLWEGDEPMEQKRNGSGGHFSYGKQMLLDNIWKKWRLRAGFWKVLAVL